MTTERFNAIVGEETILRMRFSTFLGGPQDVDIVSVEVLDGLSLIYDVPLGTIVHDDIGAYHFTLPAQTEPGVLTDRWTYRLPDDTLITEHAASFYIRADEEVIARQPDWYEQCYLFIAGSDKLPLSGVRAVVSEAGGAYVIEGVTEATGLLKFILTPGDYVLTLFADGIVFSKNNFTFTVSEAPPTPSNRYYFYSGTFSASPTAGNEIPEASKCLLFVQMSDLTGSPVANASVLLESNGLHLVAGTGGEDIGIGSSRLALKLNSEGYGQFFAVRGATIRVFIEGTGVAREVVVPDADTYNLLKLVEEHQDFYTVTRAEVPLLTLE